MTATLDYLVFFLIVASNFSLLALALNLQWGFTGLFNVGVAGFAAVGAYTTAILTGPDYAGSLGGFGLPVAVGWTAATLVSAAAGVLVGAVTLRLRQDYLAIATFGAAVVIQLLALNLEPLTGGAFGLASLPRPFADLPGSARNASFLALSLILLGLSWLGLEALACSPWGRVLRAIREDEAAARALGKNAARFRLEAFAIGCGLMGLAGGVYASFIGFVAPQDFQSILTFQVWAMLIVGGAGSNLGAVVGGILVWALWTASGGLIGTVLPAELRVRGAALQGVVVGAVLAATLLVRPQGLLGDLTRRSARSRP